MGKVVYNRGAKSDFETGNFSNEKLRGKSTLKLIVSEIAAVGVNAVPLFLWFYEDYSATTVILLYVTETLAAIVLSALFVLFFAPKEERLTDANRTLFRHRLLKDFLIVGLPGTLVIYIFIGAFISTPAGGGFEKMDFADLWFGLKIITAFLLFEFAANIYLLRLLSLKESETFLAGNFGNIVLLILSLIAGAFLATFFKIHFFLPFVVFKTLIDILAPILFFTGKTKSRNKFSGK